MNPEFQDKVAVVTGAGGTLCSAIAKHLHLLGCKVVLVGRTREKLEAVANDMDGMANTSCEPQNSHGGSLGELAPPMPLIAPCDVTDEAAVNALADHVLAELGPCRFLVNGAGGNNVKAMPTRLRFSDEDLATKNTKEHKLVWHDRKADATIFDAEIGGMRTMICRREGKFTICAKAVPAWHAKSSGKEPLANDYRDAT